MEIWVYKYREEAEEKAAQIQLALPTEQEHCTLQLWHPLLLDKQAFLRSTSLLLIR